MSDKSTLKSAIKGLEGLVAKFKSKLGKLEKKEENTKTNAEEPIKEPTESIEEKAF